MAEASAWRARRVGAHFLAGEFFPPDHTRKPPERAFRALRRLCESRLDPLRREFGRCLVHSGYRSEAHNAAVGGARRSYHVYDMRDWRVAAADVSFARGSAGEWFLRAAETPRGGVGRYDTHVHVDHREQEARWVG